MFKSVWQSISDPFCNTLHKMSIWLLFLSILFLIGCSSSGSSGSSDSSRIKVEQTAGDTMATQVGSLPKQSAPGNDVIGNEIVKIDISNVANGYYYVSYIGNNAKVKLQICGPDQIMYTYNIDQKPVYLPISSGSGSYDLTVYENISDDQYSTAFKGSFRANLSNELYPFLYSNMYVDYANSPNMLSLAGTLSTESTCDLETVDKVYQYVITNISYDEEEAKTVAFNYLPNIDEVIATKKGICFDYAALMAGMLRSQSIPSRLQIGYAGEAYHAWISIYIEDIGWIDGIIRFDGKNWSLMDPTFAANSKSSSTKNFIGDGTNYQTLYTY